MAAMQCTLPWPPKALSPNGRLHWRQVSQVKKAYRHACGWQAKAQGMQRLAAGPGKVAVTLRFIPPDRRRRDLDNLIASMKAGLDGLVDALGVDDNRFTLTCELVDTGPVGGVVQVEVQA